MNLPKGTSFSVVLVIIGSLFLVLGLSARIPIGNEYFVMQEMWARAFAILTGIIFIFFASYLEIKSKIQRKKAKTLKVDSKDSTTISSEDARAETFFYTLDEERSDSFPDIIQNASQVSILGRTAVNLISQYKKVFQSLAMNGCKVRLLFVDPFSEACKFLYGGSQEIYRHNVDITNSHISELKKSMGNNLEIKLIKPAPTSSMIIVERQTASQNLIRVQLYFLHSCVGRDRPIFSVNYNDKWYNIFMEEFTRLWQDGEDWQQP